MSTLTKTLRPMGRGVAVLMLLGAFAPGGVMAADNDVSAQAAVAAAYTNAGVDITNQASVDYVVGGVNQVDVLSNTDTFETDRRVAVLVTEITNSATSVSPDQSTFTGANGTIAFFVTNTGNDTQDIAITATNRADATDDPHGLTGTDLFDTLGSFVYYMDDGDGNFEPGVDDALIVDDAGQYYLNEVAKGTTIRVWVEPADIPNPTEDAQAVNGNFAVVTLAAAVRASDGAGTLGGALTNNDGDADLAGTIQNVFADGAGSLPGDVAENGAHSDDDVFLIAAAVVTLSKSSAVTSDPINGATNPKRIPGATIRYTLTVSNAASATAAADDVVITDVVPTNTTYATGSIFVSVDTDCSTAGDNTARTDAVDAETGHDASITGSTLSFGDTGTDIAANTSVTFCYNVTID